MKVLIAIDGSDCSMKAIEFITLRPWSKDDQFMVLSVVEPIPPEFGLGHVPSRPGYEERFYDECSEIAGIGSVKIKKGLPENCVEAKVETGLAAESICHLAATWQADLIVVGSHGRKGMSHFLLGSVAEEVLKNAPCSVAVVKTKVTHVKADKAKKDEKALAKASAKKR